MSLNILSKILGLPGQLVKQAQHDLSQKKLMISCKRDRRYLAVDPLSGSKAVANRYVKRTIRDLLLCGFDCHLEIELAQVIGKDSERHMENCEFVDKASLSFKSPQTPEITISHE